MHRKSRKANSKYPPGLVWLRFVIRGFRSDNGSEFVHMRYAAADPKRQTVPWVEYRNDNSGVTRSNYRVMPHPVPLPPRMMNPGGTSKLWTRSDALFSFSDLSANAPPRTSSVARQVHG